MKKGIKYILILLVLILMIGCQKKMEKVEYVEYISNVKNGFKKDISIENWVYEIQYKPSEYIMIAEKTSDKDWNKRLKQLSGMAWFNVSFMRSDGRVSALKYNIRTREEYENRFNYFLNEVSKSYKLIYGNDTLLPVGYEFENNYNLSPKETMVIGFKLPRNDSVPKMDMQLIYHDQLFNNGIIKARITEQNLKNTPILIH